MYYLFTTFLKITVILIIPSDEKYCLLKTRDWKKIMSNEILFALLKIVVEKEFSVPL